MKNSRFNISITYENKVELKRLAKLSGESVADYVVRCCIIKGDIKGKQMKRLEELRDIAKEYIREDIVEDIPKKYSKEYREIAESLIPNLDLAVIQELRAFKEWEIKSATEDYLSKIYILREWEKYRKEVNYLIYEMAYPTDNESGGTTPLTVVIKTLKQIGDRGKKYL